MLQEPTLRRPLITQRPRLVDDELRQVKVQCGDVQDVGFAVVGGTAAGAVGADAGVPVTGAEEAHGVHRRGNADADAGRAAVQRRGRQTGGGAQFEADVVEGVDVAGRTVIDVQMADGRPADGQGRRQRVRMLPDALGREHVIRRFLRFRRRFHSISHCALNHRQPTIHR